jgi:hypothetical protein
LQTGQFEPIPGVTVIGLGHKARHGKDTAAAAIIREVRGAQRFAFADDLYAIARVHYGMTVKDAPLLQRIGVDYRQVRGEDIWVRSVYAKMLQDRPRLAIITDVRFPNELAFVKALGGTAIRVTRFNADGTMFEDPSRDPNHVSEAALNNAVWDISMVAMSGQVAELEEAAIVAAEHVLSKAAAA